MTLTIRPAQLAGLVTVPASKSQSHRLLLCAALASGESKLHHIAPGQDVEATLRCLEELGAPCRREGESVFVEGIAASSMSPLRRLALPRLDCGESGSTLRFLIPVALAVRGGGFFTGSDRLMERPLEPYFRLFEEKGVWYERRGNLLAVRGGLLPGRYVLAGDVSSQFVTGLLYALPLLEGDSEVVLTTPLESRSYVELTIATLAKFGVRSFWLNEQTLFVPGYQHYVRRTVTAEGDWSQAAFWYAAQALGARVEVTGLDPESTQGDRSFLAYCQRLQEPGTVELDMSDCPDLLPPLALVAALRKGQTTRLTHAARLRLKESDRLSTVAQLLRALGGQVEEEPEGLTLHGVGRLTGGQVEAHNDHRVAMLAAIAATVCDGPVTLTGGESVAKSYPDFWQVYEALGGDIQEVSK